MTDREATMKAYNALHFNLPVIEDYGTKEQLEVQHNAINALDHALAQPEQTKCPRCGEVNPAEIHTCSPQVAQPEQEPIAWITFVESFCGYPKLKASDAQKEGYVPVYTAPPKREWVGLTEEDRNEIFDYCDDGYSSCGVCGACSKCQREVSVIRATEAKLKEKNGAT